MERYASGRHTPAGRPGQGRHKKRRLLRCLDVTKGRMVRLTERQMKLHRACCGSGGRTQGGGLAVVAAAVATAVERRRAVGDLAL